MVQHLLHKLGPRTLRVHPSPCFEAIRRYSSIRETPCSGEAEHSVTAIVDSGIGIPAHSIWFVEGHYDMGNTCIHFEALPLGVI